MKRINLAILAMGLLLVFQSYMMTEVKVSAELTCQDLSTCCGAAQCEGPGTPSGCSISCQGGGQVTCCSNKSGRCICGPGGT